MTVLDTRASQALANDRAHVFHSWSAQAQIKPMTIAAAEGCYFWDYDGNRYLDFSSQLVNVNIGHQHPKVVQAIQDQAARLATIAPQHANDMRGEAAKTAASATLCRCAKLKDAGGTSAQAASPKRAMTSAARLSHTSVSSPWLRGPNTTSSLTVAAKIW